MNIADDITDIVDFNKYPIRDLASPEAQSLLASCQRQLAVSGLCLLPGFVQPSALELIRNTARSLIPAAHYTEHWRATPNGDQQTPNSKLSEATRASMSCIGFDQLETTSPLRQLYLWPGLTAFINALFEGPELYITADPLVSCMLTVLDAGDELGWHYDPNDLVVSLSIQQPSAGGEFEFAPAIRAPASNASANEKAVLAGTYKEVISLSLEPGTLSLFNGHRSLHRVAPVKEKQHRMIALFNYSEVPYYSFDSTIQQKFFGRVA